MPLLAAGSQFVERIDQTGVLVVLGRDEPIEIVHGLALLHLLCTDLRGRVGTRLRHWLRRTSQRALPFEDEARSPTTFV